MILMSITHNYSPDEARYANNGCVAGKSVLGVVNANFTALPLLNIILVLFLNHFVLRKISRRRYGITKSSKITHHLQKCTESTSITLYFNFDDQL